VGSPEQQMLRSKPPVFEDDASAKIIGKNIYLDSAQSTDGMPIFIYRAYAVDAEGNRTQVGKTVPSYYRYNVPDRVTIKLENLPEEDYTLEIVAENCYGMQSEPLKVQF